MLVERHQQSRGNKTKYNCTIVICHHVICDMCIECQAPPCNDFNLL